MIGSLDSVVIVGGFVGGTEMTHIVAAIAGSSYVNKMGGVTSADSVTAASLHLLIQLRQ